MTTEIKLNVKRCPASHDGKECGSAVFYDWGLQVLDQSPADNVAGPTRRFNDYAMTKNVIICARCTTPYLLVEGDLVSVGDELSAEDVKLILSRGQAQLPHPKIKDP